jgi:hypothetical protein
LGVPTRQLIKKQPGQLRDHCTGSGHGTMVDFTVFIEAREDAKPAVD